MAEETDAAGSFTLATGDAPDLIELTALGSSPEAVIAAGLEGVIATVRGDGDAAPSDDATVAAAIRGQGDDLPRLFSELAADLLAQLDANGPGLTSIRLDGLLATDDGGYTAWGYALGAMTANPPPVTIAIDGTPTVEETAGTLTLRLMLRRGADG
jgi:hypothetical protein